MTTNQNRSAFRLNTSLLPFLLLLTMLSTSAFGEGTITSLKRSPSRDKVGGTT